MAVAATATSMACARISVSIQSKMRSATMHGRSKKQCTVGQHLKRGEQRLLYFCKDLPLPCRERRAQQALMLAGHSLTLRDTTHNAFGRSRFRAQRKFFRHGQR